MTLTADGDQTVLVIEDRGLPLDHIAAYGAGDQMHVEDLVAYFAGGEPCDARTGGKSCTPSPQIGWPPTRLSPGCTSPPGRSRRTRPRSLDMPPFAGLLARDGACPRPSSLAERAPA